MILIREENEEVFYPQDNTVCIANTDLDQLEKMARIIPRRRIRLCSHKNSNDILHEMFIYHPKNTYVRPHKHLGKDESFHLIYGEVDCIIFDDDGKITKVLPIGEYSSMKIFYYRIPSGTYHTQIFRKDTFFHEVTMGPFKREDTVFPEWAPKENEKKLKNAFVNNIKSIIQENSVE